MLLDAQYVTGYGGLKYFVGHLALTLGSKVFGISVVTAAAAANIF